MSYYWANSKHIHDCQQRCKHWTAMGITIFSLSLSFVIANQSAQADTGTSQPVTGNVSSDTTDVTEKQTTLSITPTVQKTMHSATTQSKINDQPNESSSPNASTATDDTATAKESHENDTAATSESADNNDYVKTEATSTAPSQVDIRNTTSSTSNQSTSNKIEATQSSKQNSLAETKQSDTTAEPAIPDQASPAPNEGATAPSVATNQLVSTAKPVSTTPKSSTKTNSTAHPVKLATTAHSKVLAETDQLGTWGTVNWIYDDAAKTLTFSGGQAGEAVKAPWKSNSYQSAKKIIFTDTVKLLPDADNLFDAFNGNSIEGLDKLDTSDVTNMNSMFEGCMYVQQLDVTHFNTQNVTNMANMFSGCDQLQQLDITHFNTQHVTDMSSMFQGLGSLHTLDVSHLNTSKVTDMSYMFYLLSNRDSYVRELDVSGFDTSNVTNMAFMFSNMYNLNHIDVSHFNTSKVTNISFMFYGLRGGSCLTELDLSHWDFSNIKTDNDHMGYVLTNCYSLKKLTLGANIKYLQYLSLPNTVGGNFIGQGNSGNYGNPGNTCTGPVHYTGKWIRTVNNIVEKDGPTYSSQELVKNYDPAFSGSYVWQTSASLKATDDQLIAGPKPNWQPLRHVSGTDSAGKTLVPTSTNITIENPANSQQPGIYHVTYHYTDADGNIFSQTAKITVVSSKASIKTKDTSLIAGPETTWRGGDNFDTATDAYGKTIVDLSKIIISGLGGVDLTKAGQYEITYEYWDEAENHIFQTAKITVVSSKASIKTKDTSLVAGPKAIWNVKDNFDMATDAYGKPVDVSNVEVIGQVDPTKVGQYVVTYQYTDIAGNVLSQAATITVVPSQAAIKTKNSQLIAGPKTTWHPTDNFVAATDANGQALALSQVQVTGQVVPTKAGHYVVTYHYTDAAGNVLSQAATITVAPSQAAIKTKNSQLIAGPKTTWHPTDNFVAATDANGQALALSQVQVTGQVVPTKAGHYVVTYHYTDVAGNVLSQAATITVVPSQDTQPKQPTKPIQTDESNQPTEPIKDDQVPRPVKPTTPVSGEQPNQTDETNQTVQSAKPIENDQVSRPVKPTAPVSREQPNQVNSASPDPIIKLTTSNDERNVVKSQPTTVTKPLVHQTFKHKTKQLPQTDETTQSTLTISGWLTLLLGSLLSILGLSKQSEKH